jgi:hypothetical protein
MTTIQAKQHQPFRRGFKLRTETYWLELHSDGRITGDAEKLAQFVEVVALGERTTWWLLLAELRRQQASRPIQASKEMRG